MFPGPVIPSALVSSRYPAFRAFLEQQVDMQIADLRLLLRLPAPDLEPNVGCNLTTAAALLNMISGFSVWFYETDRAHEIARLEAKDRQRRSRQRFIGFVEEYWPRMPPETSPKGVAPVLYRIRNSLVHDLGAYDDTARRTPRVIALAKHAFTLEDVVTGLERNLVHPLTVPVVEQNGDTYTVHVSALYWALHRMLQGAIKNSSEPIEAAIAARVFPEFREAKD